MILFTQNLGSGKRGGEKTTLRIFEYFQSRFSDVHPREIRKLDRKYLNPIIHFFYAAKTVLHYRPKLLIVDVSSGIRNILASIIVKLSGSKVMTIMLGLRMSFRYENLLVKGLVRLSEWVLLNISDIVLVNSNYTASYVRNRTNTSKTIVTAYPGLELDCQSRNKSNTPGNSISILFVGECSKVKGLYFLIESLTYLGKHDVHLDIVGNYNPGDSYYRSIHRLIHEKQLSSRITFHGYLNKNELNKYYSCADMFVMPSLFEGYGKTLAEALCYGLPIVATSAGAIPEMVKDGENAILVEAGNSKKLAEAIDLLLSDQSMMTKMSQVNLNKAKALNTWGDYFESLDKKLRPLVESML